MLYSDLFKSATYNVYNIFSISVVKLTKSFYIS